MRFLVLFCRVIVNDPNISANFTSSGPKSDGRSTCIVLDLQDNFPFGDVDGLRVFELYPPTDNWNSMQQRRKDDNDCNHLSGLTPDVKTIHL